MNPALLPPRPDARAGLRRELAAVQTRAGRPR